MRYHPAPPTIWTVPMDDTARTAVEGAGAGEAAVHAGHPRQPAPDQEHPPAANQSVPVRERKGDWMQLAGGKAFWPLDPRPGEVCIKAIAHSLGMQVRYNGHVHTFYSTGEHSVHMARWLLANGHGHENALWALLHDAPEAQGLTDLIRPVKRNVVGYDTMEDAVMAAVCERFDLAPHMPPIVQEIDNRILNDETAQAMDPPPMPWGLPDPRPLGVTLQFWSPARAKREFLALFDELYGED